MDAAAVVHEAPHVLRYLRPAGLRWTLVFRGQAVTLEEAAQSYVVAAVQVHVHHPWVHAERGSVVTVKYN